MNLISKRYLALGVLLLLVIIPVVVFIFFQPFSSGRVQDLEERAARGDQEAARQLVNKFPDVSNVEAQKHIVAAIITTGDMQKCDLVRDVTIEGINYGTVCRNNIAYNKASTDLDVQACDLLDDVLMGRSDCASEILLKRLVKENDISVCDSSPYSDANVKCRNQFITSEAVNKDNQKLCMELDGIAINQCEEAVLLSHLAKNPKTFSCTSLKLKLSISDCKRLQEIFKYYSGNVNVLCGEIQTAAIRDICSDLSSEIKR